ncbi:DHA2 family efflux MFS transporter permease subunit [Falsiroseomonas ponticola]|uniref:DHA2 family efflux MFS transporter permease subunit n=1 Tax=Falsiroseomonas ponticola TaxID=2786951 RepID=UPI00299EFCC8|nr:DHA2 family efflux MFS transporter permease subunit [Roseomonas ponticola]
MSAPAAQRDPRTVAAIVASALFMQNLDSSVVATALPAMARDLGVDAVHLSVAITSYLVALCVFIPVSGWVADRFGPRRVFMAAIIVFTAASALVGLSQGMGSLVAARILQGIGGAMMVPVGRLLLLRRVRKEELLTAMTWLTMPALLGPVCGPPLGGLLTDAVSWRAVFWINLPVGLLGLALVWRFIPEVERQDPGPLDAKGLTLWGLALALLVSGLETIGRGVVPGWATGAMILAGLMASIAAVLHSRASVRPAVDLSLLSVRSFGVPMVSGTLFRAGAGAVPFLLPLSLQLVFGLSAGGSGLVTFATALGAILMKPMIRPLLRRFGFRRILMVNVVLASAGVAVCAAFTPAWPMVAIFAVLALGGLSRSLQFTSMATLSFADVPQEKLAAATAMSGTIQQFSVALGVVLGSLSLEAGMWASGQATPQLWEFQLGFLIAGLVMLASFLGVARLPADAGARVSGHQGGAKRA